MSGGDKEYILGKRDGLNWVLQKIITGKLYDSRNLSEFKEDLAKELTGEIFDLVRQHEDSSES